MYDVRCGDVRFVCHCEVRSNLAQNPNFSKVLKLSVSIKTNSLKQDLQDDRIYRITTSCKFYNLTNPDADKLTPIN